ncbi:MAG: HAMP domain-containing protein [Polyangiaceae bacterium]|jgi:HAMP domain-containing protein
MRIFHQLLCGFLAVVVLFAVAGAVSIQKISSIEAANNAVANDIRIHDLAATYERGGREIQLGAFLYSEGNETMARQLVSVGRSDMSDSRKALEAMLADSASGAVSEIVRLDNLAQSAVDAVVRQVKDHGDVKRLDRDLQFLEARVEALNLLLGSFSDSTQEAASVSLSRAQATARRAVEVTFGALVGSLVLAVAAAIVIARRIAGPLKQFTDIADKISSGDPSQTLTLTGSGEIRDLATAFGRMINCFKVMQSMLNDDIQAGSP